jgi:DNA-3-methyladenine glycosylase II
MDKALKHFKKNDSVLYETAVGITLTDWKKPDDPFIDLIESIISQQLSIKAADTIFNRFKKLFPKEKITPIYLLKLNDKKIRECGISFSKIAYIKGIAQAIVNKEIDFIKLEKLDDEEVIQELVKLKGIGIWTAEMYLMFTLGRPDVFSAGDLGLQNAMIKLYKLEKKPKKETLIEISSKWSPYRTIASRILWRSNDL